MINFTLNFFNLYNIFFFKSYRNFNLHIYKVISFRRKFCISFRNIIITSGTILFFFIKEFFNEGK